MNLLDTDSATLADQVREFYDRYPYPPPVTGLDDYRRQWQDESRRRADYHLFWPTKVYREYLEILVAGCGTSQAARYALRHPDARVVGIDLSSTSIQETEKLKQRYKLSNLELLQLPVERVGELEQQFDQIICTGVLHHLPDPNAGLRALGQVLRPKGALHLMVYATYGRAGIYIIQEYCRRLGIADSEQEILDLANTLMALPPDHPLARLLGGSPDFRRRDALADALLNPQDRSYTVPQLFDLIDQSGLRFGRWLRQAPYLPQCGDLAGTPHTARLAQLPVDEQYAAVELFRGTMVRHSAILYRNDWPGAVQPIRFDDDHDWPNYVPIRLPRTRRIAEQLPAGAAAVLINQSHTYSDLYLPINELEKSLFEGIDGRRSIREISQEGDTPIGDQRSLRAFFERLWQYDQVVFFVSEDLREKRDQ